MLISVSTGIVKNYEEMLWRLQKAAFLETFAMTFLLRRIVPVDEALADVEAKVPIALKLTQLLATLVPAMGTGNLNSAGLLIAVVAAFLFRLFHLHNRISDAFNIRRNFDVDHILLPLARATGARADPDRKTAFQKAHKDLMGVVFYKYASSRSPKTLVDRHDIEQALDNWSWYWVVVEGLLVWLIGMGVSAFYREPLLFTVFLAISILYLALGSYFFKQTKKRIKTQLITISGNAAASREIRSALDAV